MRHESDNMRREKSVVATAAEVRNAAMLYPERQVHDALILSRMVAQGGEEK